MKGARAFLTLALLGLVAACDKTPTGPTRLRPVSGTPVVTPPAPAGGTVTVSGRVWVHDAVGTRPSPGILSGFVQTPSGGGSSGPLLAEYPDGGYRLSIPADGFVHLFAWDFQPCVVRVASVEGASTLTADLHVVTDPAQLGANLPPALLERTPTLSGTVFEILEDGRRAPLADTRVALDGLGGLGVVIATTLTGADGRYVLCGLDGDREPYLYIWREGYRAFETTVRVDGNTVRDIQMQR
jgi:hypothetical protein